MTEQAQKAMELLIAAGIDPKIAESTVANIDKQANKERKKRNYYGSSTKRELIEVPMVVEKTCMTCGTVSSHKTVMKVYSDETEEVMKTMCSICENCIRELDTMSKEELISLFIIQNHPLQELNMMGNAQQIKMAKMRSAKHWLTTKMPREIEWKDRDEEEFVDYPGTKTYLR
jgi:hypothetical protein